MKSKIICHMMSSVDGGLLPERLSKHFRGKSMDELGELYFQLGDNFQCDALLVGRNTLNEFFIPAIFANNNYQPTENFETHISIDEGKKTTIVLDSAGKTSYEISNDYDNNIIAILGEQVSDEYLSHLRNHNVSYLFAGKDGNDLTLAVDKLRLEFNINNLLLEGGGIINGAFLKAGLITELSLMIYPGIDGLKGAPTIFDYLGTQDELPAFGQALEYISTEVLEDGIVWIRYNFHKI
ncbi:hypothetical protein A0O34_17700 [Chryseobacterium glaciei]|uniref:Bacterial bifunctional deaminase-reductase C-terminal domain-containing protein n=1 Tax=Chryseobacterium glaciei TaxID=1685010 RepID=A0A172XZD4_9FLAO|nr:dihydrofolate reductase family protein [Chryseobacterium glaciei]ANF52240.1 hypothetical protein A0O34_17700 [Chryseobacterium glaciei]